MAERYGGCQRIAGLIGEKRLLPSAWDLTDDLVCVMSRSYPLHYGNSYATFAVCYTCSTCGNRVLLLGGTKSSGFSPVC